MEPITMKVRINLMPYLDHMMHQIGAPELQVVRGRATDGKPNVIISLDGKKLPWPAVTGVPKDQMVFLGEDTHSPAAAEFAAISAVANHMAENYGVEMHDNSCKKIAATVRQCKEAICSILDELQRFQSFMKGYTASVNLFARWVDDTAGSQCPLSVSLSECMSGLRNVSESCKVTIDKTVSSMYQVLSSVAKVVTPATNGNQF